MNRTKINAILGFVGLLVLVPSLGAQATATASRPGGHLQVGGGALTRDLDLYIRRVYGLTAWADYDFTPLLGIEAEAHFGGLISPDDITENSYLIGPRFSYRRRKLNIYGKVMFGRGTITDNFPGHGAPSSTYNIYAFGGGAEYRLKRYLTVRVPDIEMEKWGNFEPHTLSPLNISGGLLYTFR